MALLIAAAVAGIAIGICSGLLGIGGGTIMVPLFRLAFGLSPVEATATSLFTIIPTSISGGIQHVRNRTCVPKLGLALGIGGACTSTLGVALAQVSPGWAIMGAAALVIAYSSFTMIQKALAAKKPAKTSVATEGDDTGNAPKTAEITTDAVFPQFNRMQYLKAAGIGAIAGIVSGYVGVGGGFIMVPLMLAILDMPMKLASGTSLIAIMILALPAVIEQCIIGNVNYVVGIAVACGTIPGAIIGARLIKVLPERTLRFAFAAFLLLAAILIVVKELGLLG